MEKTKMYMLFGLSGFAFAGFVGAARQLHINIFSLIFSASTIYYCLTLFITYAPVLLLIKFIKTKSIEGILTDIIPSSLLYSILTLGTMLSVSNIEILIGGMANVLVFVVLITYIASLVSMKLVEDIDKKDAQQ